AAADQTQLQGGGQAAEPGQTVVPAGGSVPAPAGVPGATASGQAAQGQMQDAAVPIAPALPPIAQQRLLQGHNNWVKALAFSADGKRALSGGADFSVRLWDLETGKEIKRFDGHEADVTSVAFSPDGKFALSGS